MTELGFNARQSDSYAHTQRLQRPKSGSHRTLPSVSMKGESRWALQGQPPLRSTSTRDFRLFLLGSAFPTEAGNLHCYVKSPDY